MSDDLISRQAAIDALEELKELDYELYIRTSYSHLMEDQWGFVIKRYKEAIKETPCAQQKTGQWVKYHCCDCFRCSECDTPSLNRFRYCHECGAKMEEKER